MFYTSRKTIVLQVSFNLLLHVNIAGSCHVKVGMAIKRIMQLDHNDHSITKKMTFLILNNPILKVPNFVRVLNETSFDCSC